MLLGRVIASSRETPAPATMSDRTAEASPRIGSTARAGKRPFGRYLQAFGRVYSIRGMCVLGAPGLVAATASLVLLAPPASALVTFRTSVRAVECRSEGAAVLCAGLRPFPGVRRGAAGGDCRASQRVGSLELSPTGAARARNVCGPITAHAGILPLGFGLRAGQLGCFALGKVTVKCRSRESGHVMVINARSFTRSQETPAQLRARNGDEDRLLAEQRAEEGPPAKNPTPGAERCGVQLAPLCE